MLHLWRVLLFLATTGGLIALTHWFIYRRFFKGARSQAIRRFGKAFAIALSLSIIPIRIVRYLLPDSGQSLARLWWFWIGFSFYLVLATAALDSVRWIFHAWRRRAGGNPNSQSTQAATFDADRRRFLTTAAAGGALAISGSASLFGTWVAYRPPSVNEVAIKIPKLSKQLDGFTIVQLSDLHIGPAVTDSMMREVVSQCQALKPDVVAVTGDLVDASVQQVGSIARRILDINPRHGTFFVTGNHDYYANHLAWCAALRTMGFNVLRNARVELGDEVASFDLVGVDDWSARRSGYSDGYDLDRALMNRDPDRACILLAHQPANFEVAANHGVDLQLSGHTHGGQTFPLTALIGLRSPYSAGLYRHGEGRLYVSRGVGFVGPPMRLGSPPEIVKVILVA